MKKFDLLLLFLTLIAMGMSIWASRWIFYFKYDPAYFEHYYYRSQWHIPESSRSISDADLYKFIGYRLASGENPFNINFEVPPGVKLLYGVAEKSIGNPYWVSLSFYVLSVGVIALLGWQILRKSTAAYLAALLFALQPFIAAQIGQTMLDLPMTFFLMSHLLFVLRGVERKSYIYIVVAGIFLGLAAGTKIGVYSVLIGIVSLFYILTKLRQTQWILVFSGATLAGYVLAYVSYFMYHSNPIPWLRLHKQVLLFYLNSDVNPNFINQYLTIFIGKFNGWWDGGKNTLVREWSALLPLGFAAFLWAKTRSKYIFAAGFIILAVNTFVPFYPRYLILAIPFFTLALAAATYRHRLIILVCVGIGFVFLLRSLVPPSGQAVMQLQQMVSARNWHDLYQHLDTTTQKSVTREEWVELLAESDVVLPVQPGLDLEHNQWKLAWQENYVAARKRVKYPMATLAVIPEKVGDWQVTLRALEAVNGLTVNENWRIIRQVVPDKYPVIVSPVPATAQKTDIDNLLKLPGVVMFKD